MADLSELNNYIANELSLGNLDVTIDLTTYDNTSQIEIVNLQNDLMSITFNGVSPGGVSNFRVVASLRTNPLTINLNDVNINSGSNITLDLRGAINVTLNFDGNNTITSMNSMGIFVSNSQTVNIIGAATSSILNVNGGTNNSAIGNSYVPGLNTGGHIIFSGEGTITATGGNGGAVGTYSEGIPNNGGFAVGFASDTIGSSSVVIKCNIVLNANGGDGQAIDISSVTSVAAGNGGAGISLGPNGTLLVENCPSISGSNLNVLGGDGGTIAQTDSTVGAFTNERTGGSGGDGIQIVNGTVTVQGTASIAGGDGTTLSTGQLSFPVQAGDGGSAIQLTGTSTKTDNVILGDDVTVTAGSGGDSGVLLDEAGSIVSLTGGSGGNTIELGNTPANVVLGKITSTSGSGGTGASPQALIDEGVLNIGDLDEVPGADTPGTGGDNGSHVHNSALTNLKTDPNIVLADGTAGSGGTGINGTTGSSGTESKQFDIPEQNVPHFGYLNIVRTIDLSGDNLIVQNNKNIDVECNKQLISIKPLYISQTFENCLVIENLCFNASYVFGSNVILANSVMTLVSKTSVTAYAKERMPIIIRV